ncbi:MAG: universal stress protein [Vulcanimicrobiaceae bacterium]
MTERLLVAYDGSPPSDDALDAAFELASKTAAEVRVCYAIDVMGLATEMAAGDVHVRRWVDTLRDGAKNVLEQARTRAKERGVHIDARLLEGQTVPSIVDYAGKIGASAIVVGSHGRTGLSRLLLGSVAEGIIRHAHRPVIVVPAAANMQPASTSAQTTGIHE